jgi:hypothetical protein
MVDGPFVVQENVALLILLVKSMSVVSPEQINDSKGFAVIIASGFTVIINTVGGTEEQPTVALTSICPT